jgi:hypothetical protein
VEGYDRNLFKKANEIAAFTYISNTHYTANLVLSHDPQNEQCNTVQQNHAFLVENDILKKNVVHVPANRQNFEKISEGPPP